MKKYPTVAGFPKIVYFSVPILNTSYHITDLQNKGNHKILLLLKTTTNRVKYVVWNLNPEGEQNLVELSRG